MSENIVCTFTDAHFAELVLRVIDEVEYPRLMCDGEKEAVRKGLMLLLDRQSANECEYWDNESGFCALHRPADLKRGKWEDVEADEGEWICFKCSECGHDAYSYAGEIMSNEWKFCPYCGARMERSEE